MPCGIAWHVTFWADLRLAKSREIQALDKPKDTSNRIGSDPWYRHVLAMRYEDATIPETNSSPICHPRRKLVFQPSIFRCENVSFRRGSFPLIFFHFFAGLQLGPHWGQSSQILRRTRRGAAYDKRMLYTVQLHLIFCMICFYSMWYIIIIRTYYIGYSFSSKSASFC